MQAYLDTKPSQESRNRTAEALFHAWYLPLYRYGVIHGDPHLGNYQVRADQGLNLLDFGAIRVLSGAASSPGRSRSTTPIRDNDDDAAQQAYQDWGFRDLPRETMLVLNEWARFIHEPLLQDRVRKIQENGDPQYGRSVAEKVHAGLQKTGGVRPPREFVLMDRSAIGLGSVFLRLGAELNWHRLFHSMIDDFDEAALATRQAAALAEAGVPLTV